MAICLLFSISVKVLDGIHLFQLTIDRIYEKRTQANPDQVRIIYLVLHIRADRSQFDLSFRQLDYDSTIDVPHKHSRRLQWELGLKHISCTNIEEMPGLRLRQRSRDYGGLDAVMKSSLLCSSAGLICGCHSRTTASDSYPVSGIIHLRPLNRFLKRALLRLFSLLASRIRAEMRSGPRVAANDSLITLLSMSTTGINL